MKWNEKTVDYFVDMEEANGWSHTSYRILQYLQANQIEFSSLNSIEKKIEDRFGTSLAELFRDLTEQVENKINKQLYDE